jgi:hypothetical protein
MSGIPAFVAESIARDLNHIATFFKEPKITLIVRSPQLDDGDLVMTADDPRKAIAAIERLISRTDSKGDAA